MEENASVTQTLTTVSALPCCTVIYS